MAEMTERDENKLLGRAFSAWWRCMAGFALLSISLNMNLLHGMMLVVGVLLLAKGFKIYNDIGEL